MCAFERLELFEVVVFQFGLEVLELFGAVGFEEGDLAPELLPLLPELEGLVVGLGGEALELVDVVGQLGLPLVQLLPVLAQLGLEGVLAGLQLALESLQLYLVGVFELADLAVLLELDLSQTLPQPLQLPEQPLTLRLILVHEAALLHCQRLDLAAQDLVLGLLLVQQA